MQADGFSLDDKRQKISENNIPEIKKEWKAWTANYKKYKPANNKIILVTVDKIRKNKYDLSISRYKPVEYKSVDYEQPEVILDKLMVMEDEIRYIVKGLKEKRKAMR